MVGAEELFVVRRRVLMAVSKGEPSLVDVKLELLASGIHGLWVLWSKEIAQSESISKDRLATWERDVWVPYDSLSGVMKKVYIGLARSFSDGCVTGLVEIFEKWRRNYDKLHRRMVPSNDP
jgi:hypothetical protein